MNLVNRFITIQKTKEFEIGDIVVLLSYEETEKRYPEEGWNKSFFENHEKDLFRIIECYCETYECESLLDYQIYFLDKKAVKIVERKGY